MRSSVFFTCFVRNFAGFALEPFGTVFYKTQNHFKDLRVTKRKLKDSPCFLSPIKMDAQTLALLSKLFEENAALRKENEELKAKIAVTKPKKVKEVDPSKPKKSYGKLDPETLAAVRRENGLRLAEWRKAQKEIPKELKVPEESTEVPEEAPEIPEETTVLINNWNQFMALRK